MPNFTGLTPSLDSLIAAGSLYGTFNCNYSVRVTANTQFTDVNTGLVNYRKFLKIENVPNYATPVLGYLLTTPSVYVSSNCTTIIGLEYLLGTLNLSTNTFTSGITMPTKTIRGESIQTAANIIFAFVQTSITGTNINVSFNYTNEDGVTNRTGTFTPSTSSIINPTAIDLTKSLNATDYGIRSIQDATESGGTGGIIEFYGILPLAIVSNNVVISGITFLNFLNSNMPPYLIQTGEKIGVYSTMNTTTTHNIFLNLNFLPEV